MLRNWKTSLTGLGMILTATGDIIHGLVTGTIATVNWIADLTAITGGIGLLFAKDHNVTGGPQVPSPSTQARTSQTASSQ